MSRRTTVANDAAPREQKLNRRQLLQMSAALSVFAGSTTTATADMTNMVARLQQPWRRRSSTDTSLKHQARTDYHRSLAKFGGRLAASPDRLQTASRLGEVLDVLVVGSGYGGAVTAARLAQRLRPGGRLALLERGREWYPGQFPDSLRLATRQLRYGIAGKWANQRKRNQLGLFDFTVNDDLNVLVGSGLGGTSLINANVAARPHWDTFLQPEWPTALRHPDALKPFYQLADWELNLQQSPANSCKATAYRQIVEAVTASCGGQWYPTTIAVAMDGTGLDQWGRNRQGMIQRPCIACGDCTTGCNVGAKSTLQMNYIPAARRFGTEIYTQTDVDYLEKLSDGYRVHFRQYADCGTERHVFRGCVIAKSVVLAAGSLGSTGILLRSRQRGLAVSDQLGRAFSGNGNVLGVMQNGDAPVRSAGTGAYPTSPPPVGVAQEVNMHLDFPEQRLRRMMIQEGVIPRAYVNAIGGLLADPELTRSLFFLATGHDGAAGEIVLDNGRPRIRWPDHGANGYRDYARNVIGELAKVGGGRKGKLALAGDKPATVHPLGGCIMADEPCRGVVTDEGQVYDPTAHVHRGLYVADGAIIPTSLGANPLFTITALSERIAARMVMNPELSDLFLRDAA